MIFALADKKSVTFQNKWFHQVFALLIAFAFLSMATSTATAADTECAQRLSDFQVDSVHTGNEIMRTQNFILNEVLNDRRDCAREAANETELETFKNYFITLAYYFDFGNPDSYARLHEAMWQFLKELDCTRTFEGLVGVYNHIDCGAPGLMWTFVLLEMNSSLFENGPGPYELDQTYYLWFIAQSNMFGLWWAVSRPIMLRDGAPKSYTIDEKHIADYSAEMWKSYNALHYRIAIAARSSAGGDFEMFGNEISSRLDRYWPNEFASFDEFAQKTAGLHRDELVGKYVSQADFESGDFLGNTPASYCQGRLFVFALLFDGLVPEEDAGVSRILKQCIEYKESVWHG